MYRSYINVKFEITILMLVEKHLLDVAPRRVPRRRRHRSGASLRRVLDWRATGRSRCVTTGRSRSPIWNAPMVFLRDNTFCASLYIKDVA